MGWICCPLFPVAGVGGHIFYSGNFFLKSPRRYLRPTIFKKQTCQAGVLEMVGAIHFKQFYEITVMTCHDIPFYRAPVSREGWGQPICTIEWSSPRAPLNLEGDEYAFYI